MNEPLLIKLLNRYDVKTVEGIRCFCIPITDVSSGEFSGIVGGLTINTDKTELPIVPKESSKFVIPSSIMSIYEHKLEFLERDIEEYLTVIAQSWGYRDLGLSTAVLKKAAKSKPRLNTSVFCEYNADGDSCLVELIKANMSYIQDYWDKNPQ